MMLKSCGDWHALTMYVVYLVSLSAVFANVAVVSAFVVTKFLVLIVFEVLQAVVPLH